VEVGVRVGVLLRVGVKEGVGVLVLPATHPGSWEVVV
jgi:hypothetical protein